MDELGQTIAWILRGIVRVICWVFYAFAFAIAAGWLLKGFDMLG